MGHHTKLFPGVVTPLFGSGKRLALAASLASLFTNLLASGLLLRVGDQGNLDAIATRVNPCFSGVGNTIAGVPLRQKPALDLCLKKRLALGFDQLANRLGIAFDLRGSLQVLARLAKTCRRLIQTTDQLPRALADGRLRFVSKMSVSVDVPSSRQCQRIRRIRIRPLIVRIP